MTATVMQRVDGVVDFSLSAHTASSSRGGDGRRMSTGFAEGRGERRENRGRRAVSRDRCGKWS
jgi:hypothetical protein